MRRITHNRQFILRYYEAISGVEKTMNLIGHYTDDSKLIDHVLFFEKMFPAYQVIPDEITTEDKRLLCRGVDGGNSAAYPVGFYLEKNSLRSLLRWATGLKTGRSLATGSLQIKWNYWNN